MVVLSFSTGSQNYRRMKVDGEKSMCFVSIEAFVHKWTERGREREQAKDSFLLDFGLLLLC